MNDWVTIANPTAGHGRCGKALSGVMEELRRRGISSDVVYTRSHGDGLRCAQEAAHVGYRSIIVAGGDGTVNEVINGLASTKRMEEFTLATLPLGTGNSFLRDFDMQDIDTAISKIADTIVAPLCDVFRCRINLDGTCVEHWAFNNVVVGFGANVGDLMNRRLKPLGPLGYTVGVVAEVARLKAEHMTISIDGNTTADRITMVSISNSQFIGGDMHISPSAQVDDGLLDVLEIKRLGRIELLRQFPLIFSGRHIGHPKIKATQGMVCEIETDRPLPLLIDGDVIGTTPVRVDLIPSAIRVVR
jgi:diacylglycerol kinase (ATP)